MDVFPTDCLDFCSINGRVTEAITVQLIGGHGLGKFVVRRGIVLTSA